MLYDFYALARLSLQPCHQIAEHTLYFAKLFPDPFGSLRVIKSVADVLERGSREYPKPIFGITEITDTEGHTYSVQEEVVYEKPFAKLIRFSTDRPRVDAPRLLIFAPLSGHHATLLRDTVLARLQDDREVFITDWNDAKHVPLSAGKFDFDDYVSYAIDFMKFVAEDGPFHVLCVCQPSVPVFAACALLSEDQSAFLPKSLTLMGGPVDTRVNPTAVNRYALEQPLSRLARNCVHTVPNQYQGRGRRVYPGFLQLGSFIGMNLGLHYRSFEEYLHSLIIEDREDSLAAYRRFYDEYLATLDLPAEFYLQTVDKGFQQHHLPRGLLEVNGRLVKTEAIDNIPLLIIEGERDDISGVGQTKAALDLCPHLPETKKHYHLAPDAGHYSIFSGSKWRNSISPAITQFLKSW